MKNQAIADVFDTMADILEIQGENPFRVNSYRTVARVLRDLTEDVEQVSREDRLTDLPGIGASSAEKIAEFLSTGRVGALEKLKKGFPLGALDMLKVPGLGPKKVARFVKEKGVTSVDQLAAAIEAGRLNDMAGMGEKTIANLKEGIAFLRQGVGRKLLGDALPVAQRLIAEIRARCPVGQAEAAGSLRRMKETIGDIDILATVRGKPRRKASDDEEVPGGRRIVDCFTSLPGVAEVLAAGGTKGSVRTEEGLQVDLRVVSPESWGAALVYFTGSKEHNIRIRGIAQDRGLKINEYGVFRGKRRVAGRTEEEVYAALDLPWIPPEIREDRGEVEAAAEGHLPDLVTPEDIRGDLHAHSNYSDGALSIREIAEAARALGYEYLAITDHSASLGVAGGLSLEQIKKQQQEIRAVRKRMKGFTILTGTEVDILPDGSLDYPDEVLARMDVVIASVHTRFGMKEAEMTERILRAVRHPHVTAIGHLSGRLIGARDAYAVDVSAVVSACAESGTALELNAHMDRLDITDVVCRQAKEHGVKVLIGTDAHHSRHFWMMRLGVAAARRGWLGKDDVLNCLPAERLRDFTAQKRK